MVMQDFPFACAFYPEEKNFMASIDAEAKDNLKRIRNHPSLILLSGNNECHEIRFSWDNSPKRKAIWGEKIFHQLLPENCRAIIPDVPYIPGSPHDPDDMRQPSSSKAGDRHAWQIGISGQPHENILAEKGRFISEFGILGMAPYSSTRQFIGQKKPKLDSPLLAAHENTLVTMEKLRKFNDALFPSPKDLATYCYTSMVTQAEMLRFCIEHFRRRKFHCAGSVIWQYNDCWPAPSWAAIDWYGRKKAHYYYVRRVYQPLLLSLVKTAEDVCEVWVINDSNQTAKADLKVFICKEDKPQNILDQEIGIPANASRKLQSIKLKKIAWAREFIRAEVKQGNQVLAQNSLFGVPYRDFNWPEAEIKSSVDSTGDGSFTVKFTSDTFVKDLYAHLDSLDPDADWEDNFVDLIPGTTVETKVQTTKKMTVSEFRKALGLTHVGKVIRG